MTWHRQRERKGVEEGPGVDARTQEKEGGREAGGERAYVENESK
jgi:hypothetical protein